MHKEADINQNEPIAIIGLAGIFPGSNTVTEFFRNVLRKRCFVRELPNWLWEQELFFAQDRASPLKSYSHLGALLGDIEIDLTPFRIPPTVAKQMSLNQKLALICAREAFADARYLERDFDRERTGLIIAAAGGELWEMHNETIFARRLRARMEELCRNPEQKHVVGELWDTYEATYPNLPITEDTLPGSIGSLVTGRIASAFDLHGPHFVVDSACASSLTAVAIAVTTLRSGICDMVMTGGIGTNMSVTTYVTQSKVCALSGKGSYPFDERADGFVLGEGCGLMLLKRYPDAVRDGDHIYALIRGVGSSSDGAGKGIMAPSSKGQIMAMKRAYEDADITPAALQYIECHGTGTQVGDTVELDSVNQLVVESFQATRRQPALAIGSVKAMLGHLRMASGAAGLFRGILAVNSRVIPPQVNFEKPNPKFDWKNGHVRVSIHPEPISNDEVHVGVSGFGFGGSNSHIVLSSSSVNAREPLVNANEYILPRLPSLRNDIAFVFPGQGAQYVGMLESLRDDPATKSHLARANEIVAKISGQTLSDFIYPAVMAQKNTDQYARQEAELRDTAITQPAIFVISAILIEKVRRLGIKSGMMLGHSLGEYTALYAAGVLSFEDALRAVTMRGYLMMKASATDSGTMAFVESDAEQVNKIVSDVKGYAICANLNSYEQTVVSGETAAISQIVELATAHGIQAQTLNVDRAFHSRIISSCAAPMRAFLETLTYRTVSTPIPANVSHQIYPFAGDVRTTGELMNTTDRGRVIDLLCQQIDHPVDFVSQVEMAYEAGIRRFVEIGPKAVLTHLVDEMLQGKPFQVINLDDPKENILHRLNSLKETLSRPLVIHRRPLPTKPRYVRVNSPEVDSFTRPISAADQVRAVVARISGYDFDQISDDAEFERDLGIDTLKIIQIISLLRGTILPEKFTSFRQATSVRKIVSMAESAGFMTDAASVHEFEAQTEQDVRCYRYETTVKGSVSRVPPVIGFNVIFDPARSSLKGYLENFSKLAPNNNLNTLLVWSLPGNPDDLCEKTIPDLLQQVVKIADMTKQAKGEPAVHIVTLAPDGNFNQAAFHALTGMVKSIQKDLPYLRLSYYHIDSISPDEELIRWVLANPILGRHVFADGKVEEGQLIYQPNINGRIEELADLLGQDDVILVTGGARGIAASVVRRLIPLVKSRFLLIGRKPHKESWIDTEGQGRVEYLEADLCDPSAVRALNLPIRDITLVIHAAGIVISRPIRDIQRAELAQVLGTKILGLHRILDGIDLSRVRGVINFSSIAGYIGGDGHPDYAAANGYLNGVVCESLPILSIGWSAWDEVGMATRTETKQFLEMAGVEPIGLRRGIEIFGALLAAFLKAAEPGTQNIVVRAGMAETCFLSNDPFRSAMIAPLPVEQTRLENTSRVANPDPSLPAGSAQQLVTELASAIVPLATTPALDGTGFIALRLDEAAEYGQLHLDDIYTPAELDEISIFPSEKRRHEKFAGKLAVKVVASDVMKRWFGKEYSTGDFQVLTSSAPVRVSLLGESLADTTSENIFFSISHTDDLVCAAAARQPVGIDVEKIRTLPPETVHEICDESLQKMMDDYRARRRGANHPANSDADVLPITLFTQKEAILKASGIGIAEGLSEVLLQEIAIGSAVDAVYRGTRYRVVSMTYNGYVYSFAWLVEPAPRQISSHSTDVSRRPVAPSFGQEGIWFQEKFKDVGSTYCVAWTERLRGQLDIHALSQSLQHIVDRHEALRMIFTNADGRCQAEVLDPVKVTLPLVDLSHLAPDTVLVEVEQRCIDDMNRRFSFEEGPLFRVILFRVQEDDRILFLNFHHMTIDTTSAFIFRQELAACYRDFSAGRQPQLLPPPFQYGDLARRQRDGLTAERLDHLLGYWRKKLADCPEVLDLPTDYPRPAHQTYQAGSVSFAIPSELLNTLRSLSKKEGVTMFVTFLAAFQALLMRLSGQDDIIVGTPFVGRDNPDIFPVIGYFVNMLPLRTDMSEDPKFRKLLSKVRKSFMDALEHHELPFQKLVETLEPQRHTAYPPLFQAVIRFLHEDYERANLPGLEQEFTEIPPRNTEYDLSLIVGVCDTNGHGRFEYNCGLFTKKNVQKIVSHFLHLLESVARNPELRSSEIPLMTASEENQILRTWNDTKRPIPDGTIPAIFTQVAEQTPNAIAVIYNEQQLTYRQLNERSNQLAHYLRKQGVGPDICVGVALDRSVEMVICILGILKAGGAYVPLDPTDPLERLSFIMADASVQILLTQEKMIDYLLGSQVTTVFLDRNREIIDGQSKTNPADNQNSDLLAYVMYTSGSTGRPKGVAVSHQAIVRLLFGVDYVKLDASQKILQMAPMAFDASTFELWGALLHGGRCVLFPDKVPTIAKLKSVLRKHQINTLFLTTSLFNTLIDEAPDILAGVKQLLIGGEALSVVHVRRAVEMLPETKIISCYGPTESTTFACCYQIPREIDERAYSIPIGRPIANTTACILDRRGRPVPVGVRGELHIGGLGLARGYVNHPELTAEKFIPNPFSKELQARLYKTGDIARYQPDGNIEFFGRLDNQVKIRGFRVEPGEIESVLRRHSSVKDVVVIAKGDAPENKRLAAYVIKQQGYSFSPTKLRSYLKDYLPHYMVPQEWFTLDIFPLTPNGKIDRSRLILCQNECAESLTQSVTPSTPIERRLVKIWAELLDNENIGIYDDFFDLGGHSLLAVRLFAEIERVFGKMLSLSTLFKTPTLGQLADAISQNVSIPEDSSLVPIQTAGEKTPLFLIPPAASTSLLFINMVRKLDHDQPVYGLDPVGLYDNRPHLSTVEEMASYNIQEIQRIQPKGPYLIGGICFGVRVAYEMAQQIQRQGKEMGLLVVFDSSPPRLKPKVTFYLKRYFSSIASLLQKRNKAVAPKPKEYILANQIVRNGNLPENLDAKTQIILQTHEKARRRYFARKYKGPVALFQSEQVLHEKDVHSKWTNAIPNGIDYYTTIAGSSHYSLFFKEEHYKLLAKQLNHILLDFHANLKK